MTELALAQVQAAQAIQAKPNDPLRDLWKHANMLSESDLVPKAYQGKPANCVIAIEMANRLNTVPMMVMQNLYIVNGNPSWSSKFLIGTVNVSNRFTPIRYRYEGKENSKEWSCRAVATDRESNEELVGPRVSMDMAEKEGWSTKSGSKWRTMPEMMLAYRAAAFWTRLYCPEVSMGLHTVEEQEDLIQAAPMQRAGGMPDDMRETLLAAGVAVTIPKLDAAKEDQEQAPVEPQREPSQDG